MTRSVLRRLHRWIGLALALPLILQAWTGLIMVADPFVSSLEGAPSSNGLLSRPDDLRGADVVAVLNAARAAVSDDVVPRRWRVQPSGIVAVDFAAAGHQQPDAQVLVDARSTKVLSVRRHPDGFYRWVHSVHETLLLGPLGRSFVGWIGVGLFLLAVFGIPIWWPPRKRWKTGFTITRSATGWRFQRELHGAAGIWVVALLLLQSVSGITMAFPQTARAFAGISSPNTRVDRSSQNSPLDPIQLIAAGAASAQTVMPAATLQDLRLPPVPGRPMIALLMPADRWEGSPGAIVSMDPATGRVLSVQDPGTVPPGASVLNWLRAVHEGGAAGWVGRLVMALFAFTLPLFPVTGVAMWVVRWQRRRRVRSSSSAAAVAE